MKYKVIKSVAHNFADSFVSFMNYVEADYVMSYLARAAVASGISELRIDLLSGEVGSPELVSRPVSKSIEYYRDWLPRLLESHGVDPGAIARAVLTLSFNIDRVSDDRGFVRHFQLPFDCVVQLTDDRGRVHIGRVNEWWSADREETPFPRPEPRGA